MIKTYPAELPRPIRPIIVVWGRDQKAIFSMFRKMGWQETP
jgi:hypothetical protein